MESLDQSQEQLTNFLDISQGPANTKRGFFGLLQEDFHFIHGGLMTRKLFTSFCEKFLGLLGVICRLNIHNHLQLVYYTFEKVDSSSPHILHHLDCIRYLSLFGLFEFRFF